MNNIDFTSIPYGSTDGLINDHYQWRDAFTEPTHYGSLAYVSKNDVDEAY